MPFWQSSSTNPCTECSVIKTQLAELLERINSLQLDLQKARHERDTYEKVCITSRTDLQNGNSKFMQNKMQINELSEKVRLYQEANLELFDKCASAHDLESQVMILKARIKDLEEINWHGGQPRPTVVAAEMQTEQLQEPHAAAFHTPTRDKALADLSIHLKQFPEHLKQLPDYRKPINSAYSTTSG